MVPITLIKNESLSIKTGMLSQKCHLDLSKPRRVISNPRKIIIPSLLAITVVLLAVMPVQDSYAASLTKTFDSGGVKEITFRDISNTLPTPTPAISLNKSIYHIGEEAILTITDFNANLDPTKQDKPTAKVNGNDVPLLENANNSGVFVGSFIFDGNVEVVYTPEPPEAARAKITLDLSGQGSVTITDYIIDDAADAEFQNLPIRPVTHAIVVEISDTTLAPDTEVVVTMSYANGFFVPNDGNSDRILSNLQLYYDDFDPNFTFGAVTLNTDVAFKSSGAKTITSKNVASGFCCFEGRYVVGFDTGSAGGGGGGMVRPGLVLNLLAGLNFGSGGLDVYAPSLHYGDSSTGVGFGGILVTDENNNAFPLVINGRGYYLPEFSNFLDPVQLNTGQPVDLTLTFKESTGVEHVAIHFVDENNDEMSDTDAVITFDKGTVTKSDPQGILADDITFSNTKDGDKYSFNFGFSFDEPVNGHLMFSAWDDRKNAGATKAFNAYAVSGDSIPDEGTNHMIYLDLGAYFITADGIFAAGEKPAAFEQPVFAYEYPDFVGRTERHDSVIYDNIASEKARASQVMAEKFNLDTSLFVEDDEVKPYDTSRRASELNLSFVGHKLRDNSMSPEENAKLIKELSWQEHLKAQKVLDSLFASSKYHK